MYSCRSQAFLFSHVARAYSVSYRYLFARKRRPPIGPGSDYKNSLGAVHASDIDYALGNFGLNRRYRWQQADRDASNTFSGYVIKFVKTGNPDGKNLAVWPGLQAAFQR
ncbi:carboxylesterase family protein [Pedobacter sp. SYP-B3415]|uniref:carboxylesterase family protein n=1 Tax=Pedobacter sp. SYP-B3415 TaxID=2496641 RepID=UPI00101E11E6